VADPAYAYEKQENASDNNIIPFRNSMQDFSTSDQSPFEPLSGITLEEIKTMIESKIMEIYAQDLIDSRSIKNSPFDSIYLCDLFPDRLDRVDRNYIKRLSDSIIDKSGEISFDDGLDE
jgi:hypothetical protein